MTDFEDKLAALIAEARDEGATLEDIATGLEIARYAIQEEIDAEGVE